MQPDQHLITDIQAVLDGATPLPWRAGRAGGSIVADSAENSGHFDTEESHAFYGGAVVCESVSVENRALIMGAPQLLKRAVDEIERLREEVVGLQRDQLKADLARTVARQHSAGPGWKPGERIP